MTIFDNLMWRPCRLHGVCRAARPSRADVWPTNVDQLEPAMNTCVPVSAANDKARPECLAEVRHLSALAKSSGHHLLVLKTLDTRKTLDRHRQSIFCVFSVGWRLQLRNFEVFSPVSRVFPSNVFGILLSCSGRGHPSVPGPIRAG